MAQLPWCPGVGVETGAAEDRAEGAQDIVSIKFGAVARTEHELVGRGLVIERGAVGGEGVDDRRGDGELASGVGCLGVAVVADRTQN
jgi:hypothetical protein